MFVRMLQEHRDFPLVERALEGRVDLSALKAGFDLGWQELSLHNTTTTIVSETLGEPALLELWRATFSRSMEQRFLAAFVDLLSPLADGSLVPIARRAPRVYEYLARACGSMSWEDLSDGGTLRLTDFPEGYTFRPWLMCNLGSLQAASRALGGRHESVELQEVDERARSASFRVLERSV